METRVQAPQSKPATATTVRRRYRGEVVYVYAYDVAYELNREPVTQLLGQQVVPFAVDSSRRRPRHHSFFQPQMIRLPAMERVGPRGTVKLDRVIKLLPVGAISITVRVPFEVDHLEDLVGFHDLHFDSGSLNAEVRLLAESVHRELKPVSIRPNPRLVEEEAYTVFCLEAPLHELDGGQIGAEQWLLANRRQVAALLTQETDLDHLSKQESDESTGRYLSYYQNDLVVIDWDAALLIDEKQDFEETLYIVELANLQLAELEAYDRLIDESLERSYRDLGQRDRRKRAQVLRDLREIRINMARFNDELRNITKFFGDWHLARIYENIAARFHLGDWHRALDEKLKTLDELYEILKHDENNRWMLMLEVTIVLLFIIDLVMLFVGLGK
jgi:hypothetical protein